MQTRTLHGGIHFTGSPYFPGGGTQLSILPSLHPGITVNGLILSPDSLKPMSFLGARFLGVCDPRTGKPIAEVVEHLISACYAAGTTSVSIQTPSTVPVIGGGIEQIYAALLGNSSISHPLWKPTTLSRNLTFYSTDGTCELHIGAGDTLDIEIERRDDPEINTNAKLSVKDAYNYLQNNTYARKARPIARLKNPITHGIQQGIQLLGGRGVTRENYIFNTLMTGTEELKKQMYPEFERDGNEHLAHTLVSDFFGELHTFFPHGVVGKISLRGKNNHYTRMELLSALHESLKR